MTLMPRTLAIVGVSAWLTLANGPGVTAEPPAAPSDSSSEAPQPQTATADLPATTTEPAVTAEPSSPSATEADVAETAVDVVETDTGQLRSVKEVTLDPTTKPPVCHRYVPTGSRIATEVCQSAEVTDAARAAERDQTRRDIDEMRMRQATRDAARAAAQAEALRQRGF